MIQDHKKIAKKYIFSFNFLIDFISTFPFDLLLAGTVSKTIVTRLFRLFRLPKLVKLLNP